MKNIIKVIVVLFLSLGGLVSQAQETRSEGELSIADLPFQGYYVAPEEYAIQGIFFIDNQLLVYIQDISYYSHGDSYHSHDHDHNHAEEEDHHDHDHEPDQPQGSERVSKLFEINSHPYPDLQAYSASVRQVYQEEAKVPVDLQASYEAIVSQISPDMTQLDVIKLINNHIPGIYYTEKEGYQYFIIASPQVSQNGDEWEIKLFDHDLFRLTSDGANLIDQEGVYYEYIDGIMPN